MNLRATVRSTMWTTLAFGVFSFIGAIAICWFAEYVTGAYVYATIWFALGIVNFGLSISNRLILDKLGPEDE